MTKELEDMSKDELKQFVKDNGLGEEVDLRKGREDIIEAVVVALNRSVQEQTGEASAVPITPLGTADGPPRFRVTEDSRFVIDGLVYLLRKGKVIDGKSYDMEALRKQKVKLEPLEPGEQVVMEEAYARRWIR